MIVLYRGSSVFVLALSGSHEIGSDCTGQENPSAMIRKYLLSLGVACLRILSWMVPQDRLRRDRGSRRVKAPELSAMSTLRPGSVGCW